MDVSELLVTCTPACILARLCSLTSQCNSSAVDFILIFIFLLHYFSGPDYIKQKFQEGMDGKEKSEEKGQEKPPTPKESPHFYRKGTTPPQTPEASPRNSPPLSSETSPSKQLKRQSSTSGARLSQEKKLLATENITPTTNKPLYSKAPVKEEVAGKHQPKFSAQHNPSSTENGELHGHYHGYYVKMNPTALPQELREEDEYANPSPSTLARIPPSQKPSPARSGGKPDAKENKPDIKNKKPEFAAPKNPANNESHSAMEKEVGNSSVSTARNIFTFTALLPPNAGLCNLSTGKAHFCQIFIWIESAS